MHNVTAALRPLLPWVLLHLSCTGLLCSTRRPTTTTTEAFQTPVAYTTQQSCSNRIHFRRQNYSRRSFWGGIVSSKLPKWQCLSLRIDPNDHNEGNQEQWASDRRRQKRRIIPDDDSSSCVPPKLYQKEDLMEMPISNLLSLLVKCNIRISPTATREELVELLLLEYQSISILDERKRDGSDHIFIERNNDFENINNSNKEKKEANTKRRQNETRQRVSLSGGSTIPRNVSKRQRMDDVARVKRRKRRTRTESNSNRSIEDLTRLDLDKAIETIIPTVQDAETWGRKVAKDANRVAKLATNNLGKRINRVKPSLKVIREGLMKDKFNQNIGRDDNDQDTSGVVKEVHWYYNSKDDIKMERAKSRSTRTVPKAARKRMRRRTVSVTNVMDVNNDNKRLRMALPERLDGVVYLSDVDQTNPMTQEDVGDNAKILNSNYSRSKNEKDESFSSRIGQRVDRNHDTVERKDPSGAKRRNGSYSPSSLQNRTQTYSRKKIYSSYPQNDGNDNAVDLEELYGKATANAIDTVGEFLVDVMSGEKSFENGTAYAKRPGSAKSNFSKGGEKENAPIRRRYWKDKLAEKVDYALGVHEDGGYYKSWQDQLDRQRATESNTRDPVSIFYGNQKKRQREKKKTGPFWEEDGSLMSLLLGRNPKGRELTFHKLLERDFSVNILLKTVFKSFLAILSYVCRWASCRGALPQPIVVFVFVASALSAPKRKKVMTAFLALIATRTVAEAVHGYVYGNDDWEDDDLVKTSDKDSNI